MANVTTSGDKVMAVSGKVLTTGTAKPPIIDLDPSTWGLADGALVDAFFDKTGKVTPFLPLNGEANRRAVLKANAVNGYPSIVFNGVDNAYAIPYENPVYLRSLFVVAKTSQPMIGATSSANGPVVGEGWVNYGRGYNWWKSGGTHAFLNGQDNASIGSTMNRGWINDSAPMAVSEVIQNPYYSLMSYDLANVMSNTPQSGLPAPINPNFHYIGVDRLAAHPNTAGGQALYFKGELVRLIGYTERLTNEERDIIREALISQYNLNNN